MSWGFVALGGAALGSAYIGKEGAKDAATAAADATVPYGLNTSYGSTTIGPGRTLSTTIDPRLAAYQNRLFGDLGAASPTQELALLRNQAEPYNRAASQRLENRLFSQGRLDASQEYAPGGAMRGLFDAQLNQDLLFQQQAISNARNREQQLFGNLLASYEPERSLIQQSFGGGASSGQGGIAGAQIAASGAMNTQNFFGSIIGGGLMGYGAGGGFNGLFGGSPSPQPNLSFGSTPYGGYF